MEDRRPKQLSSEFDSFRTRYAYRRNLAAVMAKETSVTRTRMPVRFRIELVQQGGLCPFVTRLMNRKRHIRHTGITRLVPEELKSIKFDGIHIDSPIG
jgi:hypothetical protein